MQFLIKSSIVVIIYVYLSVHLTLDCTPIFRNKKRKNTKMKILRKNIKFILLNTELKLFFFKFLSFKTKFKF